MISDTQTRYAVTSCCHGKSLRPLSSNHCEQSLRESHSLTLLTNNRLGHQLNTIESLAAAVPQLALDKVGPDTRRDPELRLHSEVVGDDRAAVSFLESPALIAEMKSRWSPD